MRINGQLQHGHQRGQRRLQGRPHHGAHTEHGIKAGGGDIATKQGIGKQAQHPTGSRTDYHGRTDQAAGQPQPKTNGGGNQLKQYHQCQQPQSQVSQHGGIHRVISDAHDLRHQQGTQAGKYAGQAQAHNDGP